MSTLPEFKITTIMDGKKCPHIPQRLFPFLRYINDELQMFFKDKDNTKKINDKLIHIMQILGRLYEHMNTGYEEINNTIKEIDEELGKGAIAHQFNDNSGKIQTIFADFLLTGDRAFKHLAVLFGLIIQDNKITTLNKMRAYLSSLKDDHIKEMLESDNIRGKNLIDFRNAVEHIAEETMQYYGYEIIPEKGNLPSLKTPSFQYDTEEPIEIRNYLYPTYINIFTFIEDIIAIAINIRISDHPLKLVKVKNGDKLDEIDIFSLHMLNLSTSR